jgi:hypothetical protein
MRLGVSGHQRIPSEALGYVQTGLADAIRRAGERPAGYTSLAAGADQLFASALVRVGGELHAILPCRGYEASFSEPSDLQLFKHLLGQAAGVETLDFPQPSEDAFLEAGRRVVDHSDLLIAIWDGKPAQGRGGTADIVRYARRRGVQIEVVWPHGVLR